MSLTSELNKARRKRLEEEENGKTMTPNQQMLYSRLNIAAGQAAAQKDEDIAPVKDTKSDERTWFQKGAFEDGYQAFDGLKTVAATVRDAETNVLAGILGIGEGFVDAGAYLYGGAQSLLGFDEAADKTKEFIAGDLYDEKKVAQYLLGGKDITRALLRGQDISEAIDEKGKRIDAQSVFGDKTDALVQSAGQLAGTAALNAVGLPWWVTTGVTSFGGEVDNAFDQGAGYLEAGGSGLISAGAEILTEKLSGGIKFGGKTLGDAWVQPLVDKISNKVVRTAVNLGLDALGEGGEEFVSQIFSNLGSALYKEEDLAEILWSEEAFDEYLESFIGGGVLGGGMGSFNAANSIATGRDYKTGLTSNEQKVLDKEIENRITEAESDGKKLTSKEKAKIKAKIEEEALSDLKKGYISTDTIESALGGKTYQAYQDAIANDEGAIKELEGLFEGAELEQAIGGITKNSKQGELKAQTGKEVADLIKKGKDSYLSESYNEIERRKQTFTADTKKLKGKQLETIQKAIDSGVLNNTNRTHEFVDMIAKISADKGVSFDFTNNAKLAETGFAVEGKTVNGFVKDGTITTNIDSAKALNTVVGHEITHVLEGTELYGELQKAITEYATTKGEYADRLKAAIELYSGVDGYKGADGMDAIKREVVSDLVGDYLFTDADFVNKLTSNKNVFQKIWDEIKYLCKMAAPGSKEAKELAKAQHAFEQAYKSNTAKTEVKTEAAPETAEDIETTETAEEAAEVAKEVTEVTEETATTEETETPAEIAEEITEETKFSLSDSDGKKLTTEQSEYFKNSKMRDDNGALKVMYHGTQDAGFHTFDARFSDDDTSFFFVDRNDVAASYSGTSETYEAQTIRTAEDMNNFLSSIGYDNYEAVEKNGKFELLENGEHVADSDTAQGLYDEFCWYEGVGEGDANYKVYLNLTNPLEIDAKDRPWNKIDAVFSQEVYDKYNSLTAEEKAALTDLAEWEDFRLFNSEIQEARGNDLASAYAKMGDDCNIYDLFSVAADNFSEEAMRENSRRYLKTRDYAQKAKAEGYDGVIFKNIHDNGGYSNGSEGASTVAIAFDSNQIKSVANEKPTGDPDIRYSLSENGETQKQRGNYNVYGSDVRLEAPATKDIAPTAETASKAVDETVDETVAEAAPEVAPMPENKSATLYNKRDGEGGWGKLYGTAQEALNDAVQNTDSELYNALTYEWENALTGKETPITNAMIAVQEDVRQDTITPIQGAKLLSDAYKQGGVDLLKKILNPKTGNLWDSFVEKAKQYDTTAPRAFDEGTPIPEEKAHAMQSESLASQTDADAPPEMDAPIYGDEEVTAADPFENRDIKEVGNRKVKAYMYENPEVKPFFQAEANVMLGELQRSTKGERFYSDEGGWGGVKRDTSGAIAYLLDECKYTYKEIEKGLNAIIEDNGAENNACSKRIEFMLNERLRDGYTDFTDGAEIPPNQDYIKLLNEKQIQEYSEEARKKYFEATDDIAPMPETAETAAETAVSKESEDIAPVAEQYEAIRPPKEKQPSMKRVSEDGSTEPKGKQRKWAKTSTESEAVDGKVLIEDLEQGKIHYQPIPNKVTLGNANTRLDSMGYETSLAYFNSQFKNKSVGLDDIALGERLIQEAIKRGDNKTAGELIQNVSILGTELGQKVQALSIIKRLTPEGQLGMLQKIVERGKTKGDKAYEGVEITQEMIDKILGVYAETSLETVKKLQSEIAKLDGAKLTRTDGFWVSGDTYKHRKQLAQMGFKWDAEKKAWYLAAASGTFDQAALDKAVEEVKQDIAKQMKVTKLDKVNAWRYLSMLGNPKTHIRNLVSNVAMQGTLAVKNAVARTIESVAPVKNRTRTWKRASEAVSTFAETTTAEMKDVLSDGGKYSEDASIKAKRATFKNKVLNGIYEFNSNLLTKEDWWFSKGAFKSALSEYLTANGISTETDIQNNPEIVEKAKAYATEQAQIATFRQYSWLANKVNEIERKNAFTNMAVGSIVPFKKTPINIAKAGLNYSPLGFAKTLTYDVAQVKNGKMEASEMVDHLAQNLTGTGLTLAGYMLAMSGFLNGAGDDDKEGKYDYQLGKQAYSINIGGQTFSLSWLSPIAMPLFVGANAYEQLVEGKEWSGDVVVETLAQTLDPLSEMSFLSSLDSVLSSYDSGIQKFAGIGETMAQNYITQFVPTLSSQIAATFDDTKRTTKVAGNSDFEFFDRTVNNLKYKIPGLRNTLEPTTDIWGNDVKQAENVFARAFENFLAPYARKESIATAIDEEIKTLYGETGDDGVIPNIPYNYVNYDGNKYEMSAEEYTAFKKTYGQTACGLMEALFGTDTYRNATSEERAEMVGKVYDYARDEARKEYFAGLDMDYTNAKADGEEVYKENPIKGAIEEDLPVDEYTFAEKYPEKYSFFKENGISYDTYKSADEDGKRAYTWAYENPEKLPLAKAVAGDVVTYRKYASELYDIKADKDENGKSISGSRKEKVIDYINNMDADYGTKIILFKSEYNADDTYNQDIIDYLNSREDISYKDMETILKELGFTVHSDGRVTW